MYIKQLQKDHYVNTKDISFYFKRKKLLWVSLLTCCHIRVTTTFLQDPLHIAEEKLGTRFPRSLFRG